MNLRNFCAELKRRHVYKVATLYGSLNSPACSYVSVTLPASS
jgi:hypothetical protein